MSERELSHFGPALPRMDGRLLSCAAAVVILHGAVLAWAQGQTQEQSSALWQARGGHAVTVRMVSEASPLSSKAPGNLASAHAESVDPRPHASIPAAETGAAPAATHEEDHAIDLDGYVPRRWLTVAPEPAAPILLPFPDAFEDRARYKVVMNLYIEADGRVGRVEFEGVALPDILLHAARATFENARFTPGEVAGRIVKSLIRVEVDFNNLGAG